MQPDTDFIRMKEDQFDAFVVYLMDRTNIVENGISLTEINKIIIPAIGLHIMSWTDRIFFVCDKKKYMMYVLGHN